MFKILTLVYPTMKIGILGGSFNPVHLGHTAIANLLLKKKVVDVVWLMPCYKHALKPKDELVWFDHRRKMCGLAAKGIKGINASSIEKEFEIKYTIDLVKILKEKFSEIDFYFIIGSDLLTEFKDWKNPKKLSEMIKFIVIERPKIKTVENEFFNKKNATYISLKQNFSSSNTIRKIIKQRKPTEKMLDDKVKKYIDENRLYY